MAIRPTERDVSMLSHWGQRIMPLASWDLKVLGAGKPALELVVVFAAEVVDNHGKGFVVWDRTLNRQGLLRRILSPLCLPISPPGRRADYSGRRMGKGKRPALSLKLERQKSLELSTSTPRLRSTN